MAETTLNITDAKLLEKLKESYVDAEQKKTLEKMIPVMNEAEKNELIALIDKAKEEKDKADAIYQEKLRNLNKEYTAKLNQLVKDETSNTFKEFEEAAKKEDTEGMKEFETEITTTQSATTGQPVPTAVPSARPATPAGTQGASQVRAGKKKHGFRNFILFLLLLAVIAGGALFALIN